MRVGPNEGRIGEMTAGRGVQGLASRGGTSREGDLGVFDFPR